ncbi:TIGR03089 family protein [Ornithinimicrobium pekingense]|uniref:Acyl-CoA synthetase n=1 Tax=Ornithinimicrobium pekingense TaxID=384677 RepID=A0ABQ2F9I2_9MICO|nr:TIGR03089 family protein [Ornithinimicrobium pekingense]GGK67027.1 acyl-CoA synthetase [Ornithinimicrobium pekingense]
MQLPARVLDDAVSADATRPALTFYDDTDEGRGERIEISRRVLRTWVAKAANALQEGLDVQPGSVVLVDLPSPHWRLAYWALAVWSVGATLTVDVHEGADVLVTTDPDSDVAGDSDEVVAVTLPALSREFGAELRSGVMDEAAELASYADDFTAWDEPGPEDIALVQGGDRVSYAELLEGLEELPRGARTLLTTTDPGLLVRQVLQVLAADGSAVLVRGAAPAHAGQGADARLVSEGVDHRSPTALPA